MVAVPMSGTLPGCGVFYQGFRWCRSPARPQPPAKIWQASGLRGGVDFALFPAMVAGMINKNSVVKIDPEIMSGTPCFAGTRVPIQILIDYFEGGETLDDFLEQYPTVSREQAVAFLVESSNLWEASLQPLQPA